MGSDFTDIGLSNVFVDLTLKARAAKAKINIELRRCVNKVYFLMHLCIFIRLLFYTFHHIRSDQISHLVISDSLRPHESQHSRPPCPTPTPGIHSGLCPSSQWCHPAISSSVVLFSSCSQSLPASESFPMSQLFAWGGQSTGVSALASFLPKKSQGWSPSEWTGGISL